MEHIHFTFPDTIKKELKRMIPKRDRSRFVSHATEQALQMEKLAIMLRSKKHVGTYPEGDPDVIIKKIRQRGRKIRLIK